MFSAVGMSVCLACVTGLVSSSNPAALKAAVFFLYVAILDVGSRGLQLTIDRYLYYVVYTLGFIGIPFLYASEVAPVQLRAAVCGLSTAVSWLFNFLVS